MKWMHLLFLIPLFAALPAAGDETFVLVDEGRDAAPLIVAPGASDDTLAAARSLSGYIEKISGARPEILTGELESPPERAVWIGYQAALEEIFPNLDFDFQHPEEILMAGRGQHLVIAGRDRVDGDRQVEHGTVNAVYTFIEKYLGVRWLWPGPLGEDIIPAKTIALEPFEYRFHPPFLKRHLWPRWQKDWYRQQRIWFYPLAWRAGHAYTDWWERYHEAHPEWFALYQGVRLPPFWGPERNPGGVKLCVSNPEVAAQWIDNAAARLEEDPSLMVLSASPNDGPGFCVCEDCLSWDHPDAPPGVLTDRYVKFWNILGRGLKERFPERDVVVGAYAYSAYREPPIAEELVDNVSIGFVGHFPLAGDHATEKQKEDWQKWADMATSMVFRPNLFHSSGGHIGFPNVALRRTAEAFRWLADHNCIGIEVDTLPNSWSIHGPQFYLMAQMTYDPYLDAEAVMADYFQRGFGPAADAVRDYFALLEDANDRALEALWREGNRQRFEARGIFDEIWYDETLLERAGALLTRAEAETVDTDVYQRRVAYVRFGLDYLKLSARIKAAMDLVEESGYRDPGLVTAALELFEARQALMDGREGNPDLHHTLRIRGDIAPPAALVHAAENPDAIGEKLATGEGGFVWLADADWETVWEDDFDRDELGEEWQVQGGVWSIEEGQLVTQGGRLVSERQFPGLHRVEFEASMEPNRVGVISDMSTILHADENGRGYLLQFGGYYNAISSLQKAGEMLARTEDHVIEPGKTHTVVAEVDGNNVRLTVDGEVVLEHYDPQPLISEDRQRIGFYVYQGTIRVDRVKVQTALPVELGDMPE